MSWQQCHKLLSEASFTSEEQLQFKCDVESKPCVLIHYPRRMGFLGWQENIFTLCSLIYTDLSVLGSLALALWFNFYNLR